VLRLSVDFEPQPVLEKVSHAEAVQSLLKAPTLEPVPESAAADIKRAS
jgi:hypothetical protein